MWLKECLTEIERLAASDKNDNRSYFTVKVEGCVFHVPTEDILHFKTADEIHRVTVHSKDRILEFRGDLNALEKDIGAGFLRIHRSCLVRTTKIRQVNYDGETIVMEDGSVCLIPRKGKRLLKDYFEKEENL